MTSYRPLVAWIHIVLGVLALLPLLIVTAVFGGVWAVVAAATRDAAVSGIVGASLGVVLVIVLISTALAAGFSIAAGALSLKGHAWGDGMLLVASFFHLLNFPLGTALALFGGWVLLVREPRARFAPPRAELAMVR
ncbi:MAG: hypothetical protein AB1938_31895 [Myxococcota bacterium]